MIFYILIISLKNQKYDKLKKVIIEFMCKLIYILPCYENLMNCHRRIHHNSHCSRRPRYYRLSNYRRRIRL